MSYCRSSNVLAVAGWNQRSKAYVQVWSLTKRRQIGLLTDQQDDKVRSIALSPDGTSVVIARSTKDAPAEVKLWDIGPNRSRLLFTHQGFWPESVEFSMDGKHIIVGGGFQCFACGTVAMVAVAKGVKTRERSWTGFSVGSVAVSANGKTLACGGMRTLAWKPYATKAEIVLLNMADMIPVVR